MVPAPEVSRLTLRLAPPAFRPVHTASVTALFEGEQDSVLQTAPVLGMRSKADQQSVPAPLLALRNAIVIVTESEILYATRDLALLASVYPKPWPYARHLVQDRTALDIAIETMPRRRLEGHFFAPFTVAGNWFHKLFDNYARLYYLSGIQGAADLRILAPFWATDMGDDADRTSISRLFLSGRPVERVERGIYEVEWLIAPPPANSDDYIFAEPARFVAERLAALRRTSHTHKLRLFVSRRDIDVRNLTNEAELTEALLKRGFTIVCPGDFSFRTQIELFSAAEIVVGVHGQGLTGIIAAANCRMLMEFEAAGWNVTAYESIAAVLGIPYRRLACTLTEYRNQKRFDWLATADIADCLNDIDHQLAAG